MIGSVIGEVEAALAAYVEASAVLAGKAAAEGDLGRARRILARALEALGGAPPRHARLELAGSRGHG